MTSRRSSAIGARGDDPHRQRLDLGRERIDPLSCAAFAGERGVAALQRVDRIVDRLFGQPAHLRAHPPQLADVLSNA